MTEQSKHKMVVNIPKEMNFKRYDDDPEKYSSNLIFIGSAYNEKINIDSPTRICRHRMLQVVLYASNNVKVFDRRDVNHSNTP